MLKKINRLPGFGFKTKKIFKTKDLIFKVSQTQNTNSRFGFVVSKRVDKRATARNKIKRRLRKYIEERIKNVVPGFDFLFIVKGPLGDETGKLLDEIFKKEKFLK